MPTRYPTETRIRVRFSDTDAMGHVNNARVITYLEEGRVAYFEALFPEHCLSESSKAFPFVVADIQCAFKSPAVCGETLVVGLGTTALGNKSLTMEYEVLEEQSGRLVATAKSVLVMYDYATGKSVVMTDEFKNRVKAFEERKSRKPNG